MCGPAGPLWLEGPEGPSRDAGFDPCTKTKPQTNLGLCRCGSLGCGWGGVKSQRLSASNKEKLQGYPLKIDINLELALFFHEFLSSQNEAINT